ncbi:MAG: pyroglutamyl-peptidase I [Xanthobacteraceae bacterium]
MKSLVVLLTGFGPFPGAPFNPTGPLVHRLARLRRPGLADVRLTAHVFPTSYRAVDEELPRLLSRLRPDAVLMFGLAAGSRCLRVEVRARNAVSALIRDTEGRSSFAASIVPGGPHALHFDAPANRLVLAARAAGLPARLSHDAGRYLCNYLSWRAIEAATQPAGPRLAAFVHVPRPIIKPARRGARRRPLMGMADMVRGGEAILLAAVAAARARRRTKEK